MAQLTDDCFAFSGPLLPIQDMERMIAERVQAVGETEAVSLAAARGRVLAADVIAPLDTAISIPKGKRNSSSPAA
jgi:molybdopterin molybdotransferase